MQAQWLAEILVKNHPEPSGINQKIPNSITLLAQLHLKLNVRVEI
tara:strand:+ start:190 stop:324 length:135 start_codon:yes stop_codon:yes gene_type:complete